MRLLTHFSILFLILNIGTGCLSDFQSKPEGPNPYANGVANATSKIIDPQHAIGAPDEEYAEIGKGDGQYLLLDMGEGEEGTGNLDLIYQVAQGTWIALEFLGEAENGGLLSLEQKDVLLQTGIKSILVIYDASPIPYRYVRLSAVDGKYKIDAVIAETHLPDSDWDGLPDSWERKYGLNPLLGTGLDGPNSDRDGDLLSNKEEYENDTDPTNADTDGDGCPDKWELDNNLNPLNNEGDDGRSGDPDGDGLNNWDERMHGTKPDKKDSDGDGLNDNEELAVLRTDPTKKDSDGDGLPDGWEVKYRFNPNNAEGENGGSGDADRDGLSNQEEFKHKTDPYNRDTDADGTDDKQEIENETDPTNWNDGDLDSDGLTNGKEIEIRTNPRNQDTDGDGLPDKWELINELQPFLPQGQDGADGDPDQDMVPNSLEYKYQSNPHDSDTDHDNLPDYWEISHCLSPDDPTGENGPEGDPDQDGISNFMEMGTNQFPTIGCISLLPQSQ